MNEKLKKILDALYRNSNDFQQACEKELCDPRIPSTPTHFVYYLTNGFTPESRYYALLKDNFLKTTQGVMDKKTEEEINELVAKFSSSSTFEDVKDFFKEEIKNWDKETQDKFLDNFDKVVKGKKYDGSFFIPIITTCVVTLAKSEKIDNLDEFYDTTTKLILASKPKTLSKNYIKKLVLEKIEAAFGKESSEYAETLTIINNAKKKEQLSSNSSEPSCFTSSEYRPLRYYQNGEPVYLIQNEKLLDLTTSIEDAIKTFDLNDNSNFLKYALEKIDDEVRKYFKDKGIDLKYAIPATEAVFLTLCYQLGKEVDDNVLFAISDPLSDFLYFSPFNEEILTSIKDICKEISGKEVEFGKEVEKPAEDKKTEVDDKKTESDASTQPTDNEQEIKEAVKKLKESFLKPNQPKSIQPAFSNAKEVIVSAHYTFVGSPVFGKKSKRLSYVTPAEQNLMGNLNIGQGEGTAAKILNNAMRALKSIYDNQKKQIKASREKLINNIKAGEVVSKDEIKRVNTAIECYNKSTDPKILLKAFSRMFKSGLQKESLVSEQYLDQFKEDHPELF